MGKRNSNDLTVYFSHSDQSGVNEKLVTTKEIGIIFDLESTKIDVHKRNPPTCCQQRWILSFMGLWLGIMAYLYAVNMSLTVVCMVKQGNTSYSYETSMHAQQESNFSTTNNGTNIVSDELDDVSKLSQSGEFEWSKETQSFVLSGYFYGYLLVQVPGGWLGTKFGGRRVIGYCMGLSTAVTLLIPIMARTSVYLVVAARILLGIFIGMTPTNFCGLIGVWSLPTERSRMTGILWFGQMFGAVVSYSTSGVLCVNGFDNGWASVFYIHGTFGALFVGCWWYIAYSSPEEHPRITEEEKRLISKHNGFTNQYSSIDSVPWKKILTYPPLYVSYTAHLCDTWTFYFLLTCLPQYINEILHFNVQNNGFLSCLPFLSLMFGIAVSGTAADYVISKTRFSVTATRKLFLIIGFLGIASFILVPGFLTVEDRGLAIACIAFCTLFMAIEVTGGYSTNSVDIAPRYASVVFGISNTIASIPGAVVPLIVAALTQNQTVEEWRVVFYISAGVSVFACFVYGLFANDEIAPWADERNTIEFEVETHPDKDWKPIPNKD